MPASGRSATADLIDNPSVASLRYTLQIADGAHGPGDVPLLILTDGGTIPGPALPNWQKESMLGQFEKALSWRGTTVRFVIIGPRHVGTALADLRKTGGLVGVSRVLDGNDAQAWKVLDPAQLEYWGAGVLSVAQDLQSVADDRISSA